MDTRYSTRKRTPKAKAETRARRARRAVKYATTGPIKTVEVTR